jgi:hypothetical protein
MQSKTLLLQALTYFGGIKSGGVVTDDQEW